MMCLKYISMFLFDSAEDPVCTAEQMLPVNCSVMKCATQTAAAITDQEIHRQSEDNNSGHERYYKYLNKNKQNKNTQCKKKF